MSILSLIPVWFVLALLIPIGWAAAGAYRRAQGEQPVLCPEAGESAVITLHPGHAALMHIVGNPPRKIQYCSRWPEQQECRRTCLR